MHSRMARGIPRLAGWSHAITALMSSSQPVQAALPAVYKSLKIGPFGPLVERLACFAP
jgi:hypothetical protein